MKNTPRPTLVPSKQKYVIKNENTPIANITLNIIDVKGDGKTVKKIGSFYEKLAKRFADWANGSFKAYADRCYESDTSPRKKYRYRPLCLSYNTSADIINDTFLAVAIDITLTKDGKLVGRKKLHHLWDLSKGLLRK